ncbi:GMC family oxidoreductase N-terminal domain-containing protein (plasmid) [Agrobacterium salinitolerans]|uniref:GMC family oxidoreductase N-terminal domain-containing protein n=1 Tax=Agrobacterium salinitolerans TaxID=1183413 RepID=A0A4Z1QRU2_9HYPH|nr:MULTISPECIES: GMC family oxidoreductase N-terminal domain-containing protein [Agrobacterium]MDH6298050.1 choline dehydrogenase [Agrobacterium fabrum]UYZ10846.1 GMC family oxidoreductase N-terminal domain-containing protein [Agrobacterium salinitolerans]
MANASNGSETFDFVVVGGGTSGCVITNRLSEAGFKVCLLEAGPKDINPMIHIPAGYIKNIYSKKLTWNFMSEPNPSTNNRSFSLPQGRVVGGSSSINGLNYVRGQAIDYDNWAAEGNPGWRYKEILPYFKRSERRIGNADDRYRGRDGELPITDLDWHHPVSDALIDAAVELGIPRNPDHNGAMQDGAGFFQRTIYKGFRHSSAKAFLSKAIKRGNVDVRTNCQAAAIVFEDTRAVGIRYVMGGPGGTQREVRASKEVILTAGALNTPKLLQLSGIGPADVLGRAGISVFHELGGVGNNLRDHYAVRMVARVKGSKTINDVAHGPALLGQIARWALGRPSILAVSPSLVHIFWKSNPSLSRPDLEFACAPASFREGVVGLLDKHPGLTLGIWQERPESLGSCHVKSSDIFDAPAIQPNYLTHETDQQVLIGGMRLARRLFRSKALDRYIESEISPTPALETDDELLDFARQKGTTVYHMIGTARMGPRSSPGTVVDAELRVHGLAGLRVCDASIMPSMPSANTNASTLMIAEKAADLILGRKAMVIETLGEHAA